MKMKSIVIQNNIKKKNKSVNAPKVRSDRNESLTAYIFVDLRQKIKEKNLFASTQEKKHSIQHLIIR